MELDIDAIKRTIPHRFPFLLVDKIIECEPGQRAVGIKAVSGNEPFFQGHFPDYPLMPGVLIIEALAQVAAICVQTLPEYQGKLGVFAGIENARFKRQVRPGDVLRLEITITKMRLPIGTASVEATVDGQLAARADIMFALSDIQMGAAAAAQENKLPCTMRPRYNHTPSSQPRKWRRALPATQPALRHTCCSSACWC